MELTSGILNPEYISIASGILISLSANTVVKELFKCKEFNC